METALFKRTLKSRTERISLYFVTDLHIGHINHDHKKLEKIKKIIKNDKDAMVIIGGDNVDGRMPDHKFFELDNLDPSIKLNKFISNCYQRFEDFVSDLAPKVIGIHIGNHELKVNKCFPYVENICNKFNCAYLGYRALSILAIDSKNKSLIKNFRIFSTHGSGGGRKSGAKINRIEEEMMSTSCDIYLQGHNHFLSYVPSVIQMPVRTCDKVIIHERPIAFVNGGSFLKSYQEGNYNYSEKNSYRPQVTGCVKLIIDCNNFKIDGKIIT